MISISKIMLMLWDLLLFSMLAFPRILQAPKLVILLLIIFCMFLKKTQIQLRKHYTSFILLWLAYYSYITVLGILNKNNIELILSISRFGILLFGVLFIVTNAISQLQGCLIHTIKTSVFSGIYIGLYNIVVMILAYSGRSIPFLMKLDATANVGIHIGYSHIVSTNMSMLILLFPFLLFLLGYDKIENFENKKHIMLAIWVSGIAMILSGRRIMWLILGIALLVYFFKTSKDFKKTGRNILFFAILLVGAYLVINNSSIFSFESLRNRFLAAFISDESIGGESARFDIVRVLTKKFLERPLLGYGSAAEATFSKSGVYGTRSSFEMSYNVVLFNGGIFGSILFFGSLVGLGKYISSSRIINVGVSFAAKGAYLCCVLANATNPYFSSSFDFLIMLFLPLVIANSLVQTECTLDS